MAKWAKISTEIAASEDFAAVFDADPKAATVFLMLLPWADCYGIVHGDPRVLRGRICPLLSLTNEAFDSALDQLHNRRTDRQPYGMVHRYQDEDGKALIWIPKWHKYQEIKWERIGPPEYELPDQWAAPEGLVEAATKEQVNGRRGTSQALRDWFARWNSTRGRSRTASPEPPEEPSPEGEPEKPIKRRSPELDTDVQAAIRAAWEAFGGTDPPGDPKDAKRKRYPRLAQLVMEHTPEKVVAWAEHLREEPPTIPESVQKGGRERLWSYFCTCLKEAMTASFRWVKGGWQPEGNPDFTGLEGWPEKPGSVREHHREIINAMVSSPDWDRFPPLEQHFDGLTVQAIRAARRVWEREEPD